MSVPPISTQTEGIKQDGVSSATSPAASTPSRRLQMPSLDQLAARVAPSASAMSPATGNRPRLPTSLLARGSTTSISSQATAASGDSTAVIPPDSPTGSTSTTTDSASMAPSDAATDDAGVVEKLDRLDLTDPQRKAARGYKNVPSLDAITERFKRKESFNTAPSPIAQTPDKERTKEEALLQVPAAPAAPADKTKEHPLQNKWVLYYDTKAKFPYPAGGTGAAAEPPTPFIPQSTESGEYEAGLNVIADFATVETFCRYFNWLKSPSKLERNSNYHLFKKGIKPMWEDKANANGGRWVLTMRNNAQLLDRCWNWLVFALIGEDLDIEGDEICGAVVSLRAKQDRIQVWIRSKDDVEKINSLGKRLVKLLEVSEADGIGLEFQYNTDDRPPPNKFLTIQPPYQPTFRPGYGPGPGSSGAPFSPDSPNYGPAHSFSGPNGPPGGPNGPNGPSPPNSGGPQQNNFGAFGPGGGAFGGWRGGARGRGGPPGGGYFQHGNQGQNQGQYGHHQQQNPHAIPYQQFQQQNQPQQRYPQDQRSPPPSQEAALPDTTTKDD
ncbi:translation initiation factor eIF4e [Auriculariales sp. MPI-PUGE-AT-0066]|nr:translation initiation factor eIF4e [Auriculariales sp. MPI-PUGE-AT-0066]